MPFAFRPATASLLHHLGAIPRRLRWRLQKWSSDADREFHDTLFRGQRYEPFTFAYPGYVTIRRFADLAEAHLCDVGRVVDLGCGPGEITCELARRRPEIAFTGVDHSEAAIARAREHARSLRLANARFEVGDITAYAGTPPADVILMFDSFHHLLDPAAFVRTCGLTTSRFVLIEPGGDWLGGWARTLDLDWISAALDTVRARVVWQLGDGVGGAGTAPPAAPTDESGTAVEHRYTLDDFKRFFDGFGLEVRGTIAGIESYPPDPHGRPPLREQFGRLTYDALVAIEQVLASGNLDFHAKHWVICATRGASHALRPPRAIDPRESDPPMRVQGSYDVEYISYEGPREAQPGSRLLPSVVFRNVSWRPWASDGGTVFLSYHWLDSDGAVVVGDGLRTALPHTVMPADTCTMTCRVDTPRESGRFTLAIDLVEEGVTWFSHAGARLLTVAFTVRGGTR